MKLVTKNIAKKLPKFNDVDGQDNPKVIIHFFHPFSDFDWYVVAGEQDENGDWLFYGLVDGFCKEWGYFGSKELESINLLNCGIERDMYWKEVGVNDI